MHCSVIRTLGHVIEIRNSVRSGLTACLYVFSSAGFNVAVLGGDIEYESPYHRILDLWPLLAVDILKAPGFAGGWFTISLSLIHI